MFKIFDKNSLLFARPENQGTYSNKTIERQGFNRTAIRRNKPLAPEMHMDQSIDGTKTIKRHGHQRKMVEESMLSAGFEPSVYHSVSYGHLSTESDKNMPATHTKKTSRVSKKLTALVAKAKGKLKKKLQKEEKANVTKASKGTKLQRAKAAAKKASNIPATAFNDMQKKFANFRRNIAAKTTGTKSAMPPILHEIWQPRPLHPIEKDSYVQIVHNKTPGHPEQQSKDAPVEKPSAAATIAQKQKPPLFPKPAKKMYETHETTPRHPVSSAMQQKMNFEIVRFHDKKGVKQNFATKETQRKNQDPGYGESRF